MEYFYKWSRLMGHLEARRASVFLARYGAADAYMDEIRPPIYSARWRIGRTTPVGFMAKCERHIDRKMLAFPIGQQDNFVRAGVEIIDV